MSREKQLSPRLEANLDAMFDAHPDPLSLYWKIAADLDPSALELAQKRIRRILQRKGEIGAESAVLLACVLHLSGFPAQRLMHFLSLYLPGGISLSLFDFAVGAIFLDGVPVPEPIVYDMSRYTYLEKRLLARKSLEISARLKDMLSPDVLLFLYLLSLRDDLSNENVQLIGLVMKNCFPALGVRTRLGAASLEEYGDLSRAWKSAEARSMAAEAAGSGAAERMTARAFDRETASAFLDKYFSDAALEEVRAAAPPPVRKPRRPSAPARAPLAPKEEAPAPLPRRLPEQKKARAGRKPVDAPAGSRQATPPHVLKLRQETSGGAAARAGVAARPQESPPAAPSASPARVPALPRKRRPRTALPAVPAAEPPRAAQPVAAQTVPLRGPARPLVPAKPQHQRSGDRRLLPALVMLPFAPFLLAAVVTGSSLFVSRPWAGRASQPTPAVSAPILAAPAAPAASPPAVTPATTPYVVRPGDSLWKIYLSQGNGASDGKGWVDFLSSARALNRLGDPDNIRPGKVLFIVPPDR